MRVYPCLNQSIFGAGDMKRLVILIFILNALLLALMVPGGASVPWIAIEGLVLAGLFLWLPAPWLRRGLAWGLGCYTACRPCLSCSTQWSGRAWAAP